MKCVSYGYFLIIYFSIYLSQLSFTNIYTLILFYNFIFYHLLLREYKHSYKQACSFPTSSLRSFTCHPCYKFPILFCLPCAVSGRPAGEKIRNGRNMVEIFPFFPLSPTLLFTCIYTLFPHSPNILHIHTIHFVVNHFRSRWRGGNGALCASCFSFIL